MQGMGETGEACPFEFNFDPASFKVGDVVSYRVNGSLEGFPFVGTLVEVHRRSCDHRRRSDETGNALSRHA